MKIITVLNQKGGAGKTTISINMAACLSIQGNKVLLIDADFTQESAMTWAEINEGRYFDVVVKKAAQIEAFLKRNTASYDYVIIDCPPRANEDAGRFVSISSIVLIPVQPSPYDVWACNDLVSIIQARRDATAGIPVYPKSGLPHAAFVLSRATRRARLNGDTLDALEDTGFNILTAMTTNYEAYKRAAMTGHTIFDFPERKAEPITQIESITREIMEIIA